MSLTIVLTLKDRVEFTYRWMRYMNDVRCPYVILIADGGSDTEVEARLRDRRNYPHLDYEYIRYPHDATIDDYYRKFDDVLSRVKTEYLILADNDDFYLVDRLPEVLSFLESRPDHVGARGQVVDLTIFDRQGLSRGLVTGVRYAAVANDVPAIDGQSPCERAEALCSGMSAYDYYMNWYCVFRSSAFQDVWRSLNALTIKEVIVTEILTHVLLVLRGKIAILPFPTYIRQNDTSLSGASLVVGNQFLERCILNDSLSEFKVAVDRCGVTSSDADRERILKAIAGWLEVFVANIYRQRVDARMTRWRRVRARFKRVPMLGTVLGPVYYRAAEALLGTRRRTTLRLKSIEPYILT